jgi:hypothetical protein
MMRAKTIGRPTGVLAAVAITGLLLGITPSQSADAPTPAAAQPAPANAAPAAGAIPPMVKPAGPGVFSSRKISAARYQLVVTGHTFTSREEIENYLAYRAAQLTTEQAFQWFSFNEHRSKGDKLPVPKPDPQGMRYSFRIEFFRPVWRYKTGGSSAWSSWSPFSGAAFWADGMDAKKITAYDVSADITLHKGQVEDDNPLAFDAGALSDYLINQVEPPQ